MSKLHTHRSTNFKTIALAAGLAAGAAALVALAVIDPPADADLFAVSFDAAPPVATSPPDATATASATLLSAAAAGALPLVAKDMPSRVGSEPSSGRGPRD